MLVDGLTAAMLAFLLLSGAQALNPAALAREALVEAGRELGQRVAAAREQRPQAGRLILLCVWCVYLLWLCQSMVGLSNRVQRLARRCICVCG